METEKTEPHLKAARDMAKKIHREIKTTKFPVVLREVVKHLKSKDSNLSVSQYSGFMPGIEGVTVVKDDKTLIGFRTDNSQHRARFTLAHELGHYMFGHASRSPFSDYEEPGNQEAEANCFAAELLIPTSELAKDLKNGLKPKDLTGKYDVSEDALWWHIKLNHLVKHLH